MQVPRAVDQYSQGAHMALWLFFSSRILTLFTLLAVIYPPTSSPGLSAHTSDKRSRARTSTAQLYATLRTPPLPKTRTHTYTTSFPRLHQQR